MKSKRSTVARRVLMLLENSTYPQDCRVRQEAQSLTAAGYQVTVICPSRHGQPRYETLDGVRVCRYPAPPAANSFLTYLWEYGYSMTAAFATSLVLFWRNGFDVIHAHNPPDTFVFIAAFYKLLGKRFVYDHHDLAPEMYQVRFTPGGNRLVYRSLVLLEKLSCRLANHVITTNQSYRRMDRQRGGVPEECITIVRNGPDLRRFGAVEIEPPEPQGRKVIIGYVGVVGFQDGVDYLIRALQHLVGSLGRTDFVCVLLGSGDAWQSIQSLIQRLGLSDHLWLPGWVEAQEVNSYLRSIDIGVAPEPSNDYNDRSTVIKMMEYMALSKPIVAFDLPEHRVTAQDAAIYARPNDELDFAQKIAQLMDHPQQRRKMGQMGRKRIEKELAWSHQEKHLLEAYEALGLQPGRSTRSGPDSPEPLTLPRKIPSRDTTRGEHHAS